jgi:hypothetical protein
MIGALRRTALVRIKSELHMLTRRLDLAQAVDEALDLVDQVLKLAPRTRCARIVSRRSAGRLATAVTRPVRPARRNLRSTVTLKSRNGTKGLEMTRLARFDMLHRRAILVANGEWPTCRWLPRSTDMGRLTQQRHREARAADLHLLRVLSFIAPRIAAAVRPSRLRRPAQSLVPVLDRGLNLVGHIVDHDWGLKPSDLRLVAIRGVTHVVPPRPAVARFGRLARFPQIDAASDTFLLVVKELLTDQAGHGLKTHRSLTKLLDPVLARGARGDFERHYCGDHRNLSVWNNVIFAFIGLLR